ncbi:sodium:calcium antiporter [Candidatus Poriferisocius sp.]|uniref:sodium:calcium antiporter n=1 Tax=Candidatus Poriferisocius sp. TaxID=3101276 RepID=UPI003B014E5E
MTLAAVFLAGGLLVLAVGADQLVVGASRLAFARGISPIVIGALVIGFGTSAPEMLVSGLAAADGDVDLGVGNIVGSNVANLSLVLGVSALVAVLAVGGRHIRVANSTLWREGTVSIAAALLFWLLVQDGLERWEGIVLLAAFVLAMAVILWRPAHVADAAEVLPTDKPINQPSELVRTVLGLAATVVGAQLAVTGAVDIAHEVGLGSGFVGLSLVAFGTSLPELITGVQAARRGEADLLVGNILGSNTFNSLLVSAVVALVGPGPLVDGNLSGLAVWIMVGISVSAWLLMFGGDGLQRWWEGAFLLAVYLVSMPFLISGSPDEAGIAAPSETAVEAVVPVWDADGLGFDSA